MMPDPTGDQTIRVLQVCGSLQKQSANRFALQIAADWLRKQTEFDVEVVDAPIARVESFNADFAESPGTGAARWRGCVAPLLVVQVQAADADLPVDIGCGNHGADPPVELPGPSRPAYQPSLPISG